jgi:hypothetical protein
MSNAAAYLTEAESIERAKFLRGLGLGASKPTGLAPIGDDPAEEREPGGDPLDTPGARTARRVIADALSTMTAEGRAHPATIEDVFEGLETPIALSIDADDDLYGHIKTLRKQVAALESALADERTRAELREGAAKNQADALRNEIAAVRLLVEAPRAAKPKPAARN